jgi:hypothetical protein
VYNLSRKIMPNGNARNDLLHSTVAREISLKEEELR